MKAVSKETRRKMSEAAKRRCTPEWRRKKSDAYSTPLDTALVKSMYEAGHTQYEIAAALGVSQKVIWKHMKNHGIRARVAAKRDQFGEKNPGWKGDSAGYQAMHLRVESRRGKACGHSCHVCGVSDKSLSYDWANLTGHYDLIDDYAPMCRSCHRWYDKYRAMIREDAT